jgi:hypothetical protein
MKSKHIERIDMVKTVTGQSGDSVMFNVPTMAIKGKEGEVATITFMTPLTGSYNKSYDMGYISTREGKSSDIAVRPYDNATLNVAGGSVVVSMKDIKTILKEEDYVICEVGEIGVYMPDGTAKLYKLEKPVKVTYSKDRMMVVIDSYPSLSSEMMRDYKAGMTFPSGTPPIKIKDIASAEMSGKVHRIGYTPPSASARPTATPTAIPTATPTPTVTPTMTPTATPTVIPTATITP